MGSLVFQATLGGSTTLTGPNIAGNNNFNLPSADGTSGQALRTDGAGTLSFGTLGVAAGGTGLTAGTSGGVLYYSATATLASSAALAANALMIGGGAGAAPSTITTGTGVVTALGVNTGTAGAFVVNGGALGTPLSGTLTNATGLPLTTGVTGTLGVANGGTGLTTTPANGALDIGNGTGFTRATLTAGSGISITNGSGSITITATGGSMVYPGAGIPLSTGSAWSTSFTNSGNPITVAYGGTGVATLTGIVKGNGTSAFSAATAGTDYVAPATATNFTAQQYFGTSTLTDAATISWAANTAQVALVTIGGARTMAAPTGLVNGAFYSLAVYQDGTGGRTISWNAVFKWQNGTAPTLSTAANAKDFFVFRSDGTNLYEQGRALGDA